MTVAGPLSVRHSPDFVAAWRSVFHLPAQELGALLHIERAALAGMDADAGQFDAMTPQHEMAW